MSSLEKLEALAKAATPGPWRAHLSTEDISSYWVIETGKVLTVCDFEGADFGPKTEEANAAYIAAANPQAILSLLAEHRQLMERVEVLERQNEVDRQVISIVAADLLRTISSREWMSEGRGPYEWDDDDYQREFGEACSELRRSIKLTKHIANNWDNTPKAQEVWQACRSEAQKLVESMKAAQALGADS